MSAHRRGSKRASGGAGKSEPRPAPPHDGTLPAESFELPAERPCEVRDEPAPPRRDRVIHERRPAPRVPADDESKPRHPD